ncbi:hypothetical protein Fmac_024904 [Flemingia macrophylla]|uniref:Uncharacterized protein n=1 Tax=Flemingia macrophylla TaxID=520843 RepID=A0ABD1LQQ1_9FABA
MRILRLMLQTSIVGHRSSRGPTLDREDGFQLRAVSVQEMMPLSLEEFTTWLQIHLLKLESFSARNDVIVIRGVHDVATNTSAKARKVEGKLDAFVNLVAQLAVNQKPAFVARVYGIVLPMTTIQMLVLLHSNLEVHDVATDTSTETRKVEGKLDSLVNLVTQLAFGARSDAIVIRGVHDVATDTSAETRKVEGKLGALVNLLTQLDVNQKSASVARVCAIRSSNDLHTNRIWLPTPSIFGARNDTIVIRGVHDVATDTSSETRMVEGKLDALVNLVTQLAQPRVNEHPEAYAANIYSRGVHDVATDTSAETRKVEGKLDALVNLVTELAVNQISASVARVCFSARNDAIVIRGVHDEATDISTEARKMESKLAALMNLGTQLDVSQKPASIARVYGIRSSNDHHTNVCPSSRHPGVNERHEAYAANIYSRPPQQQRPDT